MDEQRQTEQWADALLEQNRTAPRGTELEDEPIIAYMRERSQHYGALQRRFANIEAVVVLVGVVLACAFAIAFYSGF